jgi:hypothetical protein
LVRLLLHNYSLQDNLGNNLIAFRDNGAVLFNQSSNTAGDFRIRSGTQPFQFFMDASLDRIGIQESVPEAVLHVQGGSDTEPSLQVGKTGDTGFFTYIDGNQSAGYVLTSDANGKATWQPAGADANDYTTGATLNGNILEFDRTDLANAYSVDLSPLTFTGNTSGDCITDLYVTNIYGCSPLHIEPSGVNDVYMVENGGDVGIGTSTPTAKLHLAGDTSGATLGFQYTNLSNDIICRMADNGQVQYNFNNLTTALFRIKGGSDQHLFVADPSTDFVGIGPSAPSAKLHIQSDGSTSSTDALIVQNSSSSTLLHIQDNGDVGIGTSTPTDKLHLDVGTNTDGVRVSEGSSIRARLLNDTTNSAGVLELRSATGTLRHRLSAEVNGTTYFAAGNSTHKYGFNVASTEASRNFHANVSGVLFRSPSGQQILEIRGTGSHAILDINTEDATDGDTYIRFQETGTTQFVTGWRNVSDDWRVGVSDMGDGNAKLVVKPNGSVGVGTVSPSSTLQIGDTGNTATLRYVDGNETSGYVLTSDANGNATWQAAGGGGVSKYATTSAFTASVTQTITHSLGTSDIVVELWDNAASPARVDADVEQTNGNETNALDITFSVGGTYKVVVIG